MAPPKVGRGGAFLFGAESTWGTADTITNHLALLPGSSLDERPMREVLPMLYQNGMVTHGQMITKRRMVTGRLRFLATYENFGLILKHIMGAVATSGPSGSQYTHTHTLATLDGLGLTGEKIRGNATNSITYEGLKIRRATFRCQPGTGYLVLEVDVLGETSASPGSPTTVSLGSGQSPVLASQLGNFSLNGTNYNPLDFSLTVEADLDEVQLLGSLYLREPACALRKVSMEMTVEHNSDTPITELLADTSSADLTWTFTGSGDNSLGFTLQNQRYLDVSEPLEGHGVIKQAIRLQGLGDGSDLGLSIVNKNSNSSAVAN